MRGPGIKHDERIYGASLLDVTPTVLTLFGLPVADDMDGRPMLSAFEEPAPPERIASWEQVEGECGMHSADHREDPFEAQGGDQTVGGPRLYRPARRKQREGGGDGGAGVEVQPGAGCIFDAARSAEAAKLFEELLAETPNEVRFALPLAQCYLRLGRLAECRKVVESLMEAHKDLPRVDLLFGALGVSEGRNEEALIDTLAIRFFIVLYWFSSCAQKDARAARRRNVTATKRQRVNRYALDFWTHAEWNTI